MSNLGLTAVSPGTAADFPAATSPPAAALHAKAQLAAQLQADMQAAGLTKMELARRMGTSRSALNRLLDASDTSLTLGTMASVATALGRLVTVQLVPQAAADCPQAFGTSPQAADAERSVEELESAEQGIWDWHVPSGRMQFGARWCEMLGYAPDELAPDVSSWERLVHPDDLPRTMSVLREHLNGYTASCEIEYRILTKSGQWRWMLNQATVVSRDAAGRAIRAVGTHRDIESRQRAQDGLLAGERLNRDIIERMTEGFVVLDGDFRITHINAAGLAIDGRGKDELIGRTHWEAWDSSRGSAIEVAYRQAMAQGVSIELEHHYRSELHDCWLELRAYPAGDGLAIFFRDITERKAAEHRQAFAHALAERLRLLGDPCAMMDEACAALGEWLGAAQVGWGEVDEHQAHVTVHRDWNDGRIASVVGAWRLDDFGPAFILDLKAGQTVAIADIEQDGRTNAPHVRAAYKRIGAGSLLDVPLVKDGRLVALLFVHHPTARRWLAADIAVVEQTCERLWAAVERARAERALAMSEARFHGLFDSMFQLMGLLAPDGTLMEVNQAALDFGGLGREQVIGRKVWDTPWMTPETAPIMRAAVARAAAGHFVRHEFDIQGAAGATATLDFSMRPVRNEHGQVVLLVPEGRDVTEMRTARAALAASEARFARAVSAAGIGTWDWNAVTDTQVNSVGFEALYGRVPGELRSRADFMACVHPDDRASIEAAIGQAVAGNAGDGFEIEYRVPLADGSQRWLRSQGAVTRRDRSGAPLCINGVVMDVTKMRQTEAALREADQRKDEFLAMLAHELRNPLAPLTNAIRLIDRTEPLTDRGRGAIAMAARQARQLQHLVDDLLEVNRISRGTIRLKRERMTVGAAIHNAVEAIGAEAAARVHRLTVDVPSEPLWVEADPVRVAQMLGNLLTNACKYMPDGGRITVSAAAAGNAAEIRVADTGVGIDPAKLPRVFELFHQIDATLDRSAGGLGIGLAMVKRLAELHGGTIWAESEGVGCGAVFVMRLPRNEPA